MTLITIDDILKHLDKLPTLPEAVLQASRMMEDPDTSAEELAQVIRVDSYLTGQILRLSNSAAYGLTRQITTVKEAVAILGFKTIKSLVYTIITNMTFDRPVAGYFLQKGDLWVNALTGAVYAKYLAEFHKVVDPELAFTGAILRDIGKIVLEDFVGNNFSGIEQEALKLKTDFAFAEESILGFSHTEVGLKIGDHWNLPSALRSVIQYHHAPSNMSSSDPVAKKLVTIVHLGDAFSMILGHGLGGDGMMYSIDTLALKSIGIEVGGSYLEDTLSRLLSLQPVIQSLIDSFSSGQESA